MNNTPLRLSTLTLLLITAAIFIPGCDEQTASSPAPLTATPTKAPIITGGQPKTQPLVATDDTRLLVVDVEGMTCNGCAWTIAEAAKKLPGAVDASASFEAHKAWLLIGKDSDLDTQKLIETINALADGQMFTATAPATATP